MHETPPRRSRRPPPNDSGSSFPLIPVVLGTIVIGFVIGAGLSIAGKRGVETVAVATAAPTQQPTLAPATLAPTERPAREPTSEPETPPAVFVTHAPATRAPSPESTMSAVATHASASEPAHSRAPQTSAPHTGAPHASAPQTPASVAHAIVAGSPVPAPADDADSEFARLAAGVVRGYLGAVARGDSAAAATSLASSSDRVTESSVVDATTRIKHVEARGAGDAAAVNVDFDTSNGTYFGQYTVRRTPSGAAVIVTHTIIKP